MKGKMMDKLNWGRRRVQNAMWLSSDHGCVALKEAAEDTETREW